MLWRCAQPQVLVLSPLHRSERRRFAKVEFMQDNDGLRRLALAHRCKMPLYRLEILVKKLTIAAGLAALSTLAMPIAARAATCEETFVKKGNAVTGLRFMAMTAVPDMPIDVAINQMRGIAARRGYDIIASEPASGALLIEQPLSGKARAFPITISATVANGVGTVQMEAKLPAAMGAPTEGVRTEMCGMLAQLKGGKDGRLAARTGGNANTVQAAPVQMTAQAFSQQISKDAERNAVAVSERYARKRFTLSGNVDYVIKDGDRYRVAFKIQQPYEMALRLPNMARVMSGVSCLMAPGTSVFVMQLKPGKGVKLTGTFYKFDEFKDHTWFMDCTPEKN